MSSAPSRASSSKRRPGAEGGEEASGEPVEIELMELRDRSTQLAVLHEPFCSSATVRLVYNRFPPVDRFQLA